MKLEVLRENSKRTIEILKAMTDEERRLSDGWVSAMMNARRCLAVCEIYDSMTAEEKQRIAVAFEPFHENRHAVKDIKVKYGLSWTEIKWMQEWWK